MEYATRTRLASLGAAIGKTTRELEEADAVWVQRMLAVHHEVNRQEAQRSKVV